MSNLTAILLFCILGFFLVGAEKSKCNLPIQNKPLVTKLSDAQLQFTLQLYKEAAEKEDGNWVFSPFSLSLAGAMYLADRDCSSTPIGKTLKSFLELNSFTDPESLNKAFGSVIKSICTSETDDWIFKMANRMYVNSNHPSSPTHLAAIRKFYRSRAITMKFDKINPEKVTLKANRWVAKQTGGRITNLVNPSSFSNLTKVVFINALYFKAKWAITFNSGLAYQSDFHFSQNHKIQVDMMSNRDDYFYSKNDQLKCQMLGMDYVGERVAMYIILPDEIEGLSELENKLTPENLKILQSSMSKIDLMIAVPKFKLEHVTINKSIKDLYEKNELNTIGSIRKNEEIEIVHRAFININEQGTEAAAATELKITVLSRPKRFFVDRPFIFFIYDKTTNMVLFIGRIMSPFLILIPILLTSACCNDVEVAC